MAENGCAHVGPHQRIDDGFRRETVCYRSFEVSREKTGGRRIYFKTVCRCLTHGVHDSQTINAVQGTSPVPLLIRILFVLGDDIVLIIKTDKNFLRAVRRDSDGVNCPGKPIKPDPVLITGLMETVILRLVVNDDDASRIPFVVLLVNIRAGRLIN